MDSFDNTSTNDLLNNNNNAAGHAHLGGVIHAPSGQSHAHVGQSHVPQHQQTNRYSYYNE